MKKPKKQPFIFTFLCHGRFVHTILGMQPVQYHTIIHSTHQHYTHIHKTLLHLLRCRHVKFRYFSAEDVIGRSPAPALFCGCGFTKHIIVIRPR